MGPLLLAANVDEVITDKIHNAQSLLFGAVVEELLKEVVPILVFHYLGHVLTNLVEQKFN